MAMGCCVATETTATGARDDWRLALLTFNGDQGNTTVRPRGPSEVPRPSGALQEIVRVFVSLTEPRAAVMLAVVVAETFAVFTVNVADVFPAGTVTEAGTVAPCWLERAITIPPLGAAELNVTVPVEDAPPLTLAGESDSDDSAGGFKVRSETRYDWPKEQAIPTVCSELTGDDLIVKDTEFLPAGTVTVEGTVANFELLDRSTTIPPVEAVALTTTVPIVVEPPVIVLELKESEVTLGGLIVSVAVLVTVPNLAVMVTDLTVESVSVFATNEPP